MLIHFSNVKRKRLFWKLQGEDAVWYHIEHADGSGTGRGLLCGEAGGNGCGFGHSHGSNAGNEHALKQIYKFEVDHSFCLQTLLILNSNKNQTENSMNDTQQQIKTEQKNPMHLGKQIIVVEAGFVYVGDCTIGTPFHGHAGFVEVTDAKNLRGWGTKRGLGELASGPTKTTEADDCGFLAIPYDKILLFIKVTGGW